MKFITVHQGVRSVLFVVQVVRQDGALERVTVVHQHDVAGILLPDLLDVRVDAGHSIVGGFLVVFIAVTPDIAVHVCGSEDGDGHRSAFGGCLLVQGALSEDKADGQKGKQRDQTKTFDLFHTTSIGRNIR
jgi:hypothetical protein